MAKAKTTPAGPGHNSLPHHDDIRTAAAAEMIFEEKEKKLREEKKRMRLRLVEGKGLVPDDTKFLKGLRDKTASEVIDVFKRQWHLVGAFFPEQHEQMDLFTKKSDAPTRAAYYTMGLLAGLQGKDLEIPPLVAGDDRQQMIDGHNEGRAKYKAAWDSVAAGDPVVDGTGKGPGKGKGVGEQAAKDFAKDQGADPLVVDGVKYDNMRQANAARKRLEAKTNAAPPTEAAEQTDAGAGDAGEEVKPLWDDFPHDNTTWTNEQKAAFAGWFMEASDGAVLDADDFEHPGAAAEVRRLQAPDDEPAAVQAGYLHDPGPVIGDDFKGPSGSSEVLTEPANPDTDLRPQSPPSTATESSGSTDGGKPTPTSGASTDTSSTATPSTARTPATPKRSVARPDFNGDSSGNRWDDDWEKWTGPQCMEFRRWVESLPPPPFVPPITHPGAVDYFNLLREEAKNREDAGPDDGFEATPEELAQQQSRPSRQEVQVPDPADIEAGVKKLQENGFAAPAKRTSRKRTPA